MDSEYYGYPPNENTGNETSRHQEQFCIRIVECFAVPQRCGSRTPHIRQNDASDSQFNQTLNGFVISKTKRYVHNEQMQEALTTILKGPSSVILRMRYAEGPAPFPVR